MKLKTLKDFEKDVMFVKEMNIGYHTALEKVKKEAVKWVKEDFDFDTGSVIGAEAKLKILKRWMKRFNITEEDLK